MPRVNSGFMLENKARLILGLCWAMLKNHIFSGLSVHAILHCYARQATYLQYRQVGSPLPSHAVILFVSSIARTNLELELVTRGGALITAAAATASPLPPATARPKSCFLPLLHVLAIHMKIMSLKPLVADWCQISGLWQDEDDRSLLVQENDVPVLLRDPVTILLHFALILPVQIDRAFFTSVVRQVYNLCWVQAALRIACRLPAHHRALLRDEWARAAADPANPRKVDTLSAGLGILLASTLHSAGLFNDDTDPGGRGPGPDHIPHDVTYDQLEVAVQAGCLPYLRIAALLRHYIYHEPLPDIWEPDWEFTRLAQFLGLADCSMSGRVLSAPCLGWLVPPAPLLTAWTTGTEAFTRTGHLAARKLVLTNIIWQQPQLLRLPRNYDSIFQVMLVGGGSFELRLTVPRSSTTSGSARCASGCRRTRRCACCAGRWSA